MQNAYRKRWIITYAEGAEVVTYGSMKRLKEFCSITELHYTIQRGVVYVYMHFSEHVSQCSLKVFLDRMMREKNIYGFEVFGYDSIAASVGESRLEDHVGFKILLSHYQTNNAAFVPCTLGKPHVVRGALWKNDLVSRLQQVAHRRSKHLGKFCDDVLRDWAAYNKETEFDVVKKRRQIDSADSADDSCPASMNRFREFESSVLAVLNDIQMYDIQTRYEESLLLEEDAFRGSEHPVGGVYVAVCDSIKFPKIGATRKNHEERLMGISRYVPTVFQLIYWIPSRTPFKTEAAIHRHFSAFRIKQGANTEFFDIDVHTIGQYLRQNFEVVIDRSDLCAR